jgi:hypothetical protein
MGWLVLNIYFLSLSAQQDFGIVGLNEKVVVGSCLASTGWKAYAAKDFYLL